jgi:small subunit ribosomal protein S18
MFKKQIEKSNRTNSDRNNSKIFFRKNKGCTFSEKDAPTIDYKDPELLSKFISEGGRMLPSRITNVSSKNQRALKKAIKRARILALMPFICNNR